MTVESVPLGSLAEISRDAVAPDHIKSGTRYVGLENITGEGQFIGVRPVENGDLASTKFAFTARHVLYGKLRPYLRKIARPNFDGICSTDILPLLPGPRVDRSYLAHFLRLDSSIAFAESRSVGVNLPRISPSVLATLAIPLPPLEEQRRIAAVLDKADALRQKRCAALQKLDSLTPSAFQHLFLLKGRLGASWRTRELGGMLEFLTSGSRGWATYYSENGSKFLRIQNVKRDRLDLSDLAFVAAPETQEAKRTKVRPGDVLMSITADLGRTAVVPESIGDAYINQHLSIIRTTEVDPVFLSSYLSSPDGQRQIQEKNRHGVKAGLNFDDIRSIHIPLPPIELQARYANAVRAIERQRLALIAQTGRIDFAFASLQYRAFHGEL